MAHAVRISSLTEQLVEAIITQQLSKRDAQSVKTRKEVATRKLRHHNFGRTNQFVVQKSLQGLVEKFEVLNKDDLATALTTRLKRLADLEHALEPELLSLLLHLSEKPADKASVDTLEPADVPEQKRALTWDDVLADDPFTDDDLWNEIEDTAQSSDEDDLSLTSHTLSDTIPQAEHHPAEEAVQDNINLESLKIKTTDYALENIRKARAQQNRGIYGQNSHTTELQVIREILHSLLGLPSPLFERAKPGPRLSSSITPALPYVSHDSITAILAHFTVTAADISVLRNFVDSPQREPLWQTFSYAIRSRLRLFDLFIAAQEKDLVATNGQILVSIIDLRASIEKNSRHLLALKDVVVRSRMLSKGESYRLLDELYDLSCKSQTMCDNDGFRFFTKIFFECLLTFLRPIATWMEHGTVENGLEFVCISSTYKGLDLASFWRDGYSIAKSNGRTAIPAFALEATDYIFSSGKSIAFLKLLGVDTGLKDGINCINKEDWTLQKIEGIDADIELLPFDALFKKYLYDWVRARHRSSSKVLRDHFVNQYGLLNTVDALERVFLSKDGAAFQNFADKLFDRLDGKGGRWNDTVIIENLAYNHLIDHAYMDAQAVRVESASNDKVIPRRTVQALSCIKVTYKLSWPILNIIPESCMETYQRALVFLLQVYRASSLLSRCRCRPMDTSQPREISSNTKRQADCVAYALHHRLLHTTTTIHKYLTQHALETLSTDLHKRLFEAQDIDTMIVAHETFISALDMRLLLSDRLRSVRETLLHLLNLACAFCDVQMSRQQNHQGSENRSIETADQPLRVSDSDDNVDPDDRGVHPRPDSVKSKPQIGQQTYLGRMQQMRAQHAHLMSIIIAGLRGGTRSEGGDESWELLAESLEWSSFDLSLT